MVQSKKAILLALREGQDGPAFARVVETVLLRDRNWVKWKEQNCPDISRMGISPKAFSDAAATAKASSSWKRLRDTPMGSLDLSFLSETQQGNMDDLTDSAR